MSSKSPKGQNLPPAQGQMAVRPDLDTVQMKLASEASKRAEEERMRRLQLQEEQDLAYAMALSKAESASLKTTS